MLGPYPQMCIYRCASKSSIRRPGKQYGYGYMIIYEKIRESQPPSKKELYSRRQNHSLSVCARPWLKKNCFYPHKKLKKKNAEKHEKGAKMGFLRQLDILVNSKIKRIKYKRIATKNKNAKRTRQRIEEEKKIAEKSGRFNIFNSLSKSQNMQNFHAEHVRIYKKRSEHRRFSPKCPEMRRILFTFFFCSA